MTFKKNYEDNGDFRQPKVRRVVTKNREEQRIKHALRHGDLRVVDDYEDEDVNEQYEVDLD